MLGWVLIGWPLAGRHAYLPHTSGAAKSRCKLPGSMHKLGAAACRHDGEWLPVQMDKDLGAALHDWTASNLAVRRRFSEGVV